MLTSLVGFEDEIDVEGSSRVIPVMLTSSYVLFPGSTVSVITTQPSYVAMAEQAIERGEQVGVLLKKSLLSLSKNDEEGFHGVGCMGVVGQIKLLEEAKYAITLIGTQRFRVQRELSYYPYPIFVVDMLNDGHVPGYGSRMRKLRTFMEELFLDLYRLCEDHEGRMEWIIDLLDATFELDEEDFVNVACTNMPISTLEKQMLLEYSMTLERFEKAAEILEFEHQRRLLEGSMPLSGPSWDSLS